MSIQTSSIWGTDSVSIISYHEDSMSNRPESAVIGSIFKATDTGRYFIYSTTGWQEIGKRLPVYAADKYIIPVPEPDNNMYWVEGDLGSFHDSKVFRTDNEVNIYQAGATSDDNFCMVYLPNYGEIVVFGDGGSVNSIPQTGGRASVSANHSIGDRDPRDTDTDGYRVCYLNGRQIFYHDGIVSTNIINNSNYSVCTGVPAVQYYSLNYYNGVWVAAGANGLATSTNGIEWVGQSVPVPGHTYYKTAFRESDQTLWVASASDDMIYKTNNFGTTWSDPIDAHSVIETQTGETPPTVYRLRSVYFSEGRLFAVWHGQHELVTAGQLRTHFMVIYSDDDGQTWSVPSGMNQYGIEASPSIELSYWYQPSDMRRSPETGSLFFSALGHKLWKSTDNGENWTLFHNTGRSGWPWGHVVIHESYNAIDYVQSYLQQQQSLLSGYNMNANRVLSNQISDTEGTNHISTSFDPTVYSQVNNAFPGLYELAFDGSQGQMITPHDINPSFTLSLVVDVPNNATAKKILQWDVNNYLQVTNDSLAWVVGGSSQTVVASGLPTDTPVSIIISHDGSTAKAWINGDPKLNVSAPMSNLNVGVELFPATTGKLIYFGHTTLLVDNLDVTEMHEPNTVSYMFTSI